MTLSARDKRALLLLMVALLILLIWRTASSSGPETAQAAVAAQPIRNSSV